MKGWVCRLLASAALGMALTRGAEAAPPPVPETIYQWVQSSERINYFFNKEQICYAVRDDGTIDLNALIVPVLKTYDDVQIKDVRMKRTWRTGSSAGLEDLAGEADYLTIDLARGVVRVDAVELLDSHFWTLDRTTPGRETAVADLTEKSRDGIFYRAILAYEREHRTDILAHTKGELRAEDRAHFEEEEKRHEKERRAQEKQLEKERREQEKRRAKEKREAEKRLAREKKEAAAAQG